MATISRTEQLNYFSATKNSNKVWIGTAYADGTFEARWGRVRDGGNLSATHKRFASEYDALRELERKVDEKLGKGYRFSKTSQSGEIVTTISPDLAKTAKEQIRGAEDPTTAALIEYLAGVNIHRITENTALRYHAPTGSFSTPLGILTPDAITTARELLTAIAKCNQVLNTSTRRAGLVNDYFQLVPKDFGFRVPPASQLLATPQQVADESAILDALEATVATPATLGTGAIFDCKLNKVPHWTAEGRALFRRTRTLFESTRNTGHHPGTAKLQLKAIYEVEVATMKSRFEAKAAEIGNVQGNLWHGTRASNLLSILKAGLIIPPASASHCTGRMFGNGIYTSRQSTKALNYATDYWNQSGARTQRTFMFLCEAALGRTAKNRAGVTTWPVRNTDSTWVDGGQCGVLNHECIVYEAAQINLQYLCEFGL